MVNRKKPQFRKLNKNRDHIIYTQFEHFGNYEIDNNFLFELLSRSKFRYILNIIKLIAIENYYSRVISNFETNEEISVKYKHYTELDLERNILVSSKIIKRIKRFGLKDLDSLEVVLTNQMGLNFQEVYNYYYRNVPSFNIDDNTLQSIKNYKRSVKYIDDDIELNPESGELLKYSYKIAQTISKAQEEANQRHAAAVIIPLLYKKPTVRFNRHDTISLEINISQPSKHIIEYVENLLVSHSKDNLFGLELLKTDIFDGTYKISKEYKKQEYYADLLYTYDRMKINKFDLRALKSIQETLNQYRKDHLWHYGFKYVIDDSKPKTKLIKDSYGNFVTKSKSEAEKLAKQEFERIEKKHSKSDIARYDIERMIYEIRLGDFKKMNKHIIQLIHNINKYLAQS